jgi:hypothetical protein
LVNLVERDHLGNIVKGRKVVHLKDAVKMLASTGWELIQIPFMYESDEFGTVWKEMVAVYSEVLSQNFLGDTNENLPTIQVRYDALDIVRFVTSHVQSEYNITSSMVHVMSV